MPPTGKTRKSSPLREGDGRYKKLCGATIHTENDSTLLNLHSGKKVKRKTCEVLLEKQLISKKTRYVCSECIEKVEEKGPCSSCSNSSNKQNVSEDSSYQHVSDNLCKRSGEICEHLEEDIRSDISYLYKDNQKCSMESLLSYDPEAWLKDRPACLVGLLRKLCGLKSSTQFENTLLAKCIEVIYGCRNKNIVLPLSFQENLLVYSLSRNKQLIAYNSKLNPGGSEAKISRWISQQADTPVQFPDGTVRAVFNNEQVVGKSHRVKSDNKLPTSIITSHMYIKIDESSLIQNNPVYAPENWLFTEMNDEKSEEFVNVESESNKELFRESRYFFISDRLSAVSYEMNGEDIVKEFIDRKNTILNEKVCIECGGQNEISGRKCTNCGGALMYDAIDFSDYHKKVNPYRHFRNIESKSNNLKVMTGEPDLCNPSSFKNVSEILYNLACRAGIEPHGSGERKWLFLECDGGIYTIVEKLLFNVFHCSHCHEAFYGKDAFSEHRCSILYDVTPTYEFGWLIPLPGLLHIEMNACKAFFEINWDIFMKPVCYELGFKTPRAQECAKKCLDHHKTFKIIEILYIALCDELLVPFVQHCKSLDTEPTAEGYWDWCDNVVNPNYLYCQQMAFTFLHSIMVFRVGCRRGNADLIVAGRNKLSLLFYCRNHPRYQRIMAVNLFIEKMMPDVLKGTAMSSLTLSRTGNTGHYQGGDACLEELNREAKSWISPVGVPTESDWLKVFRNLDSLNEIKRRLLNTATGKSADQGSKHLSSDTTVNHEEVVPVRALLRPYLSDPLLKTPHTNLLKDIKLSDSLENITAETEALRQQYYQNMLSEEPAHIPVICVTEEELQHHRLLENQTKVQIQKKIFLLLEQMPDKERKLMEEVFNKTVKGKRKSAYIDFYYTLSE